MPSAEPAGVQDRRHPGCSRAGTSARLDPVRPKWLGYRPQCGVSPRSTSLTAGCAQKCASASFSCGDHNVVECEDGHVVVEGQFQRLPDSTRERIVLIAPGVALFWRTQGPTPFGSGRRVRGSTRPVGLVIEELQE